MKLEITLLRTRVARRMLVLFLVCAVVPIITLAAITYPVVMGNLEAGAREQLRDDSKGAGMLILARLEQLAGMLRWNSTASEGASPSEGATPFLGIATEHADGRITAERGSLGPLPSLDSMQRARLASGKTVLLPARTAKASGGAYLVVRGAADTGSYPRIWGYFTVAGAIDGMELMRRGISFCVEDRQGPLACSDGADSSAGAGAQLAEKWTIFLKNEFGALAWQISASQPRSDAFIPLAEFRRSFLLGLLIAIVLVFVLSHIQIRRRMTPLADLEEGTRRLSNGDFSSRVVIESDDEFRSLGTAFNQMASDLERQFITLSALNGIDHAALQDHSAGAIAAAVLQGAPGLLGADRVALATAPSGDGGDWRLDVATRGEASVRVASVQPSLGDLADLTKAGDHLIVAEGERWPEYCGSLGNGGCQQLSIFPIMGTEGPIGALIACLTGEVDQHTHLLTTGRQLADQLALGLSNVSLLQELDSLSLGALTALARTIDASSHWTSGHSERVTQYALEIARGFNFSAQECARLRQGGLLHDIGKIGVPPAILDKPGPLTETELAVMQSHPEVGARIVESVRAFRYLVPLVLCHHELLDGSGYPAGLRGDEIPDLVRVLTVADVFDALTSDRPYRAGLSAESALEVLDEGAGKKFDARAIAGIRAMVAAGWAPSVSAVRGQGEGRLSAQEDRLLRGRGFAEEAA